MRRLPVLIALLVVSCLAQTVNNDILPASTGLNLGRSNQRFNGFFQNINIQGTCTLNGASCFGGGGGNVFNGKGFGTSWQDVQGITPPPNPSTGLFRLYINANTNLLACLTSIGGNCNPSGGGGGGVSSVGLTQSGSIFSITGSPVTSSGSINLAFATQSQNLVFASPNGGSGNPLFRAIVPGDISGAAGRTLTGGGTSSAFDVLQLDAANGFSGADACAKIKTAIETSISGSTAMVTGLGFSSSSIACANPPFATTDLSRLQLPCGSIAAQNTWIFGQGMFLEGCNRASGTTGSNGTVITAQNAGSSNTVNPIWQLGNGSNIFGSGGNWVTLYGAALAGVEGVQNDYCQEECLLNHIKIVDTTVAGFDCGAGSTHIQHGCNIVDSETQITAGGGASLGPSYGSTSVGITVSSWTCTGATNPEVCTVTPASMTGLFSRAQVYIAGATVGSQGLSINGYYFVTATTGSTFTINLYNPGLVTETGCGSSCGTGSSSVGVWSYNQGFRLWNHATSTRPVRNTTIAGTNGTNMLPPLWCGTELSGHGPAIIEAMHVEGYRGGICIGNWAQTDGFDVENADLESGSAESGSFPSGTGNCIENGIIISNQFGTPFDITLHEIGATGSGTSCASGGFPTNTILDLANGNTLTKANNPRVGLYMLDGNGFPLAVIADCAEMTKGWCEDGTSASGLYASGVLVWGVNPLTGVMGNITTGNISIAANYVTSNCTNSGSTGTTLNTISKYNNSNPVNCRIATTADTAGMLGICVASCGTSGIAQIAIEGKIPCVFDGATTAGDFVQISATTAGNCHDAGAVEPTSGQVIGQVQTTNGGGGTFNVQVGMNTAGGGFANPMTTLGDVLYGGASGVATRLAGPTATNNVTQFYTETPSSGAAVAPVWTVAGIVPRASTCGSNTDTILATDRQKYVSWTDASACAVTLPQAGTTGFASNFAMKGCNIGAAAVTITPTTSNISYSNGITYTSAAANVALTTGQCLSIFSDNTNYFGVLEAAPLNFCTPGAFATQTDASTITWAIGSSICGNGVVTFTAHSGSRTLNLTGLVSGGSYVFKMIQDGTGGESLTGGSGCTWKQAGGGGTTFTLTASAGAIDIISFTYDGTNCLAILTKAYA